MEGGGGGGRGEGRKEEGIFVTYYCASPLSLFTRFFCMQKVKQEVAKNYLPCKHSGKSIKCMTDPIN